MTDPVLSDRHRILSQILRMNAPSFEELTELGEIDLSQENHRVRILGLIQQLQLIEMRSTTDGAVAERRIFGIELVDPRDGQIVHCHLTTHTPVRTQNLCNSTLLRGQLVGIEATIINRQLVCLEVSFPGLPSRQIHLTESEQTIASISDLHVGSRFHNERLIHAGIECLNRYARERRISAVTITGDLIEGFRPERPKDYTITQIDKQYEHLGQLLRLIDSSLDVFVIPGNHDLYPVEGTDRFEKMFEPQPVFPSEIRQLIDPPSNIHLLTNPATIQIDGRTLLLHHGDSFHTFNTQLPPYRWDDPIRNMRHQLELRHLDPMRVARNSTGRDPMCVREVPDVYITGHIHLHRLESFNGVQLINASTFQDRTGFQEEIGLVPEPGFITLTRLSDLHLSSVDLQLRT